MHSEEHRQETIVVRSNGSGKESYCEFSSQQLCTYLLMDMIERKRKGSMCWADWRNLFQHLVFVLVNASAYPNGSMYLRGLIDRFWVIFWIFTVTSLMAFL
jgi:hypothetical protein